MAGARPSWDVHTPCKLASSPMRSRIIVATLTRAGGMLVGRVRCEMQKVNRFKLLTACVAAAQDLVSVSSLRITGPAKETSENDKCGLIGCRAHNSARVPSVQKSLVYERLERFAPLELVLNAASQKVC